MTIDSGEGLQMDDVAVNEEHIVVEARVPEDTVSDDFWDTYSRPVTGTDV